MLQPFFDFMDKLSTEFTLKRLLVAMGFILILFFGFIFYENITSDFTLRKYERTVKLLEEINKLNSSEQQNKEVISNIYNGLHGITERRDELEINIIFDNLSFDIKKAITFAFPWLFMLLFIIPKILNKERDAGNSFLGIFVIACLLGVLGYFLPAWFNSINIYIYISLGVSISLIIFFARIGDDEDDEDDEDNK